MYMCRTPFCLPQPMPQFPPCSPEVTPSSYPGTDFIMGCLRSWAWSAGQLGASRDWPTPVFLGLWAIQTGVPLQSILGLGSMRTGNLLIWNSLGWNLYGPGSIWSDIHRVVVHTGWGPRGLTFIGLVS